MPDPTHIEPLIDATRAAVREVMIELMGPEEDVSAHEAVRDIKRAWKHLRMLRDEYEAAEARRRARSKLILAEVVKAVCGIIVTAAVSIWGTLLTLSHLMPAGPKP